MLGQEVVHATLKNGDQDLDVAGLEAGMYFISFYDDDTPVANKTFVKQ